jgi:hypothetical protein
MRRWWLATIMSKIVAQAMALLPDEQRTRDHPEGVPRHDLPGDRGPARLSAQHREDEAVSGTDRSQAPLAGAGAIRFRFHTAMTNSFRCDDKHCWFLTCTGR